MLHHMEPFFNVIQLQLQDATRSIKHVRLSRDHDLQLAIRKLEIIISNAIITCGGGKPKPGYGNQLFY